LNTEIVETIEVRTCGRPVEAVASAFRSRELDRGGVYHVSVAHDDGCPCLTRNLPLPACSCEIVRLHLRRRAG